MRGSRRVPRVSENGFGSEFGGETWPAALKRMPAKHLGINHNRGHLAYPAGVIPPRFWRDYRRGRVSGGLDT
jgi:hypothetical protein